LITSLEAVSRHTLSLRAVSRPLGRRVAQCLALPEQPWQPHTMASPSVHMFIARNPQAVGSMPKVPKAVLTVRGQICLVSHLRFFAPIHRTAPVLHHPPHLPTPPSSSPARAPTAFGSGCGCVATDLTAVGAVGALAARVGREAREVHTHRQLSNVYTQFSTRPQFPSLPPPTFNARHLACAPPCAPIGVIAVLFVTSCRCDFSCIGAVGGVRKDGRCRLLGK
jgi:hypothetical protein